MYNNVDLGFAYSFKWSYPQEEIGKALKLLMTPEITEEQLKAAYGGESDVYSQVRKLLASNPAAPAEVLEQLSKCKCARTLERIATNPNTTPETLAELATHECSDVRAAVAENSNTDIETIKQLMNDECIDVRFTLAENHQLPEDILRQLADDENPYVAYRAETTLGRLHGREPSQMPAARPQSTQKRAFG